MKLKKIQDFIHQINNKGFGIIEIIVAIGIFATIAMTGVTTVIGSFSTNRLGDEETKATIFAQEGIEAVRSIKNQDWSATFLGTNCSSSCGVGTGSGIWEWSGSENISDKYTRSIVVSDVERNGSGDIVESGGTDDPDTKKVTSTVSWNFTPTRNNTVELTTYLTNFRKAIGGDWSSVSQIGNLDISGNQNGLKVATAGNYAYVVLSGGNPDFVIIDISNPSNPIQVAGLNLPGSPRDVEVQGDFAYVASTGNTGELQIINISTPSAPLLIGLFNVLGNSNANAVEVVGDRAYLVRDSSGQDELAIVDVSLPAIPTLTGSLNLGANANAISIQGSYAYVATDSDSQELLVINISNPSLPSIIGSYNSSGSQSGVAVASFGSFVFLGLLGSGNVDIVNISNPTTPSLVTVYNGTDDIRDMTLSEDNLFLFLATSANSQEFQVVGVSNPTNPNQVAVHDVAGNNDLNGVAYSVDLELVLVVGDSNSEELIIIAPQ